MMQSQVNIWSWCHLEMKKLYLVKHTEPAILEELYGITLINECAQSNTPGLLFEYIH